MANKMYCPRCSREFSDEVGFCRDCGLSLDGVAKIVTGEAATAPAVTSGPNYGLMRVGFAIFILGLVIALGNAALSAVLGFSKVYGTSIFLFTVMAGLALIGAGVVIPRKRYVLSEKKRSGRRTPSTAQLPQPLGDPIGELFREPVLTPHEPVSVTENTTRNLN